MLPRGEVSSLSLRRDTGLFDELKVEIFMGNLIAKRNRTVRFENKADWKTVFEIISSVSRL